MITISVLYRCIIAIFLCLLNLTLWLRQIISQFISRHRYTITVNIDVTRNDFWNVNNQQIDKIQFNKTADVLAIIINEHIPDNDLCKFIVNAILFFRQLNIQHLIIYDYEGNHRKIYFINQKNMFFLGYIKARESSIMDYVQTYDKKRMNNLQVKSCESIFLSRLRSDKNKIILPRLAALYLHEKNEDICLFPSSSSSIVSSISSDSLFIAHGL